MLTIRSGRPEDAPECGRICHDAFAAVSGQHNFPPDFPSVEAATGLMTMLLGHPGFYSVMAEVDGALIGSNFLDERNPIAGVGPITIDPHRQNSGAGRRLMQAVIDRGREKGFAGVRLLQSSYHARSLALYTTLGFIPRESAAVLQGPVLALDLPGYPVRPAVEDDIRAIDRLCTSIHGHDRGGEVRDAVAQGVATLVERQGRVTGYSTGMAFFAHTVGETNEDVMALIGAAPSYAGPGILVPIRNAPLFRWCLENGLKVQQVMTVMSMGLYNEPQGAWMPSVFY